MQSTNKGGPNGTIIVLLLFFFTDLASFVVGSWCTADHSLPCLYDGPYLPDISIGESHGMKWYGAYHFTPIPPITDITTTQTRTNKLFFLFFRIFIVLDLAITYSAVVSRDSVRVPLTVAALHPRLWYWGSLLDSEMLREDMDKSLSPIWLRSRNNTLHQDRWTLLSKPIHWLKWSKWSVAWPSSCRASWKSVTSHCC